ncbi:MAG: isocitrate lyase/phosphoenolpyruvate mutase family protein [Ferruginibacter sp.]
MIVPTGRLTREQKAKQFHQLHHSGKLLVLPNIWDCIGALLLEDLNYPAIATASASVAFSNGYDDGENIPFDVLLALLGRIANSVNVPVTADIESGYADNDIELKNNIRRIMQAGIVGINIEDTDKKTKALLPVQAQCEKIKLMKKIADEMSMSIFINARTDVYIQKNYFDAPGSQLEEAISRGLAYKAAGADCFFPLAIQHSDHIKAVIDQLQMPVNILTIPGIPELNVLNEYGVARVSLGPSFLKIVIRAMKETAMQLKDYQGLSLVTQNEITSDYLKKLVSKNKETT